MIRFSIAGPGFNNRLVCGTINYFNGWVVNSDKPITEVQFHLGTRKVGSLPIRRDRPDLVKRFGRSMLGFSGWSTFLKTLSDSVCDSLLQTRMALFIQ